MQCYADVFEIMPLNCVMIQYKCAYIWARRNL